MTTSEKSKVLAPAATRRKPPNAGKGRVKGVPNKVTGQIKTAIADALDGFAPRIPALLDEVAGKDAARALEIVAKLAEFAVPKLTRGHLTAQAVTLEQLIAGDPASPLALPDGSDE